MTPAAARRLVPLELAAVLAIAAYYALRDPLVPVVAPLFLVATMSCWARGRSWADAVRGSRYLAIGAAAGLVALAAALLAGTPLVELSGRGVEWSQYPIVRGSPHQLFSVALLVAISAVAAELALRGWIVERALELGASTRVAVAVGALAEGIVWPGELAARAGAAIFGTGLGWMYVAAGRRAGAPIAARVMFGLGAVLLEGLRLVG